MRILLLADCNSTHTQKWAISLAERDIEIYIFSLSIIKTDVYKNSRVQIIASGLEGHSFSSGILSKLKYLKLIPQLRTTIKSIRPDIVHAHYASSYGLLAALVGYKPVITSVWGSDVFDFPKQNNILKRVLEFNFRRASRILSTSHIMANEAKKYTSKEITITPFGIDLKKFTPTLNKTENKSLVIGTVKSLEKIYGIDLLIRSFAQLVEKLPDTNAKLVIVGDGTERTNLMTLIHKLGLENRVQMPGKVDNDQIPEILNSFDIFASLSLQESFGVSALEAMACGIPVIVSDAPGFNEIVTHQQHGLIVPRNNTEQATIAMTKMLTDPQLRISYGKAARRHIVQHYDWEKNVNQMIGIYTNLIHNNPQ
ncbi:MAG: glycosyltransferase [Bacteroidales bacterium]|nr:glycosyltransferase [Bacteroidales bacterium]